MVEIEVASTFDKRFFGGSVAWDVVGLIGQ